MEIPQDSRHLDSIGSKIRRHKLHSTKQIRIACLFAPKSLFIFLTLADVSCLCSSCSFLFCPITIYDVSIVNNIRRAISKRYRSAISKLLFLARIDSSSHEISNTYSILNDTRQSELGFICEGRYEKCYTKDQLELPHRKRQRKKWAPLFCYQLNTLSAQVENTEWVVIALGE